MRLHCEACQAALRAEDVRFDLALAKCNLCGAVYDFASRQTRGAHTPEAPRGLAPIRPRAARPANLREEGTDEYTALSWRWFRASHVFMAFFCLMWDVIMVMALIGTPIDMWPFLLLHLGVGAGFSYVTLAGMLNTTRVEASRSELTIRHGPLPWPGNRTVPGHELTQLYCQEARGSKKGLFGMFHDAGDLFASSYSLHGVDRQGRQVKLLSGLEDKNQVLYLELALERQLGIEDSPVAGELAERVSAR
jgi:hypothetical protein